MTHASIASIVEGHGEMEALPALLRAVALVVAPTAALRVPRPVRVPKGRLVKSGELERAIRLAVLKLEGPGAVMVLLDADDDCPATEAPRLLERARTVAGANPVAVVLAKCEYESWFLAAAESLRGRRGLRADLSAPAAPESIRGAKEWLSSRMASNSPYSETLDQAALTASMDVNAARAAPSFDKFYREVSRLIELLVGQTEDASACAAAVVTSLVDQEE